MAIQETLNYWKQLSQVMKFFREEEDPNARLPKNFISGFLEVRCCFIGIVPVLICFTGKKLISKKTSSLYIGPEYTSHGAIAMHWNSIIPIPRSRLMPLTRRIHPSIE
jgi:hypothetical protein